MILDWCQRLQDSAFGTALLGSRYMFPLVETTHVMSLALSAGLLTVTDLRLMGVFMRRRPVSDLLQPLRPWMLAGFALSFISGGLLFWAEAANVYVKPFFRLKLLLIGVAAANALCFEWRLGRRIQEWDQWVVPPAAARLAGWVSLICWGTVILCGRWVAYGV